jgi:hypothetical protein
MPKRLATLNDLNNLTQENWDSFTAVSLKKTAKRHVYDKLQPEHAKHQVAELLLNHMKGGGSKYSGLLNRLRGVNMDSKAMTKKKLTSKQLRGMSKYKLNVEVLPHVTPQHHQSNQKY